MERTFTPEQVRLMSRNDAENELSNIVYQATVLLEQLEYAGKIRGNAHHARQAIAKAASEEVKNRWID